MLYAQLDINNVCVGITDSPIEKNIMEGTHYLDEAKTVFASKMISITSLNDSLIGMTYNNGSWSETASSQSTVTDIEVVRKLKLAEMADYFSNLLLTGFSTDLKYGVSHIYEITDENRFEWISQFSFMQAGLITTARVQAADQSVCDTWDKDDFQKFIILAVTFYTEAKVHYDRVKTLIGDETTTESLNAITWNSITE